MGRAARLWSLALVSGMAVAAQSVAASAQAPTFQPTPNDPVWLRRAQRLVGHALAPGRGNDDAVIQLRLVGVLTTAAGINAAQRQLARSLGERGRAALPFGFGLQTPPPDVAARRSAVVADTSRIPAEVQQHRQYAIERYSAGDIGAGSGAMRRVVGEIESLGFPALNEVCDLLEVAMRSGDIDGAVSVVSSITQEMLAGEGVPHLARLHVRLAVALAGHHDESAARVQMLAVHDLEQATGMSLFEPAVQAELGPQLRAFDAFLGATEAGLACTRDGHVSAGAVRSLRERLVGVAAARALVVRLGEPTVSVRAYLREAAVLDEASTQLEQAQSHCLAGITQGPETDRHADALERQADRIERRNPSRADALRIQALLLRERTATAPASTRGELDALGADVRALRELALASASALLPYRGLPSIADAGTESDGRMRRTIARALQHRRSNL